MKLKDLYSKPINRAVNPAVSATKFDPETERIEIQEYVFTDEIINGLFRILDAIKNNKPYDHVGIWIDGYYGSGKSHFLKYLDYCITPSTREDAVSRLLDAVKAIDPLDEKHNLNFDYDELLSIANWLKRATIDTCIFNLETSYDNSTDKKKAFLHVFWNESMASVVSISSISLWHRIWRNPLPKREFSKPSRSALPRKVEIGTTQVWLPT